MSRLTDSLARGIGFLIQAPDGTPSEERRALALARVALPLALGIHILFGCAFAYFGVWPMVVFNIGSVLLWSVFVWRCFARNEVKLAFTLGAGVEIPLHAICATLYVGVGAGFILYVFTALVAISVAHFLSLAVRSAVFTGFGLLFAGFGAFALVAPPITPLPIEGTMAFFVFNSLSLTFAITAILLVQIRATDVAEAGMREQQRRAERLLRNILPEEVAEKLKTGPDVIADEYPEATILFADIVGFTSRAEKLPPTELVRRLDQVFTLWDEIALKHGVEKIKTIGDAYMAVCGAPTRRPDHAVAMVVMAQDMLASVDEINKTREEPLRIRIGINTGPIVAGVIGQSKFAYDLWGDAVNLAARMEQSGEPDLIQMTEQTRDRLGDMAVTDRGEVTVKGRAPVRAFTIGRADAPSASLA
ncbi:MAG: adenylate/guanylate cyclase domain-containing protein [Pseudomonadota bacterium]